MPLTPQITLTINLLDLQGEQIGTVGNPAFVEIALCNFGPILPRVLATGNIAKVGPYTQRIPYLGAEITVTLWGNDVLYPAGTYYAISILDDALNILQSGAYVFTGTIDDDLSNRPQIFPSATSSVMGSEVALDPTSTPEFDCGLVNGPVEFWLVLTKNVTNSTLLPNFAGQIVIIRLQQNATGGYTFAWPNNVTTPPTVESLPNAVTIYAGFVGSDGIVYPINAGSGGSGPDTVTSYSSSQTIALAAEAGNIFGKCIGGSGGISLALPSPVGLAGQKITLMKTDSGVGAVTLTGAIQAWSLSNQYQYATFESDGANWYVVANN